MRGKASGIVALLVLLMLIVTLVPLANIELVRAQPVLDSWQVILHG